MPKIAYGTPKKFHAGTLRLIETCNGILHDYDLQGYELTLRQLYYQLVSRGIIENNDKSYKNLGSIVNDARLAGLIDWNGIIDRTRNLKGLGHWDNPAEIIKSAARSYRVDMWENQRYRPEVWVEKDALAGVVARAANELDVPYFSCRGYTSQSEMWRAAQRMQGYRLNLQTPVIIHLGDHDPSGIDMSRDIEDRLVMFMGGVDVRRIALNMDQVEEFNPPPNPAKLTDSRCEGYIQTFGDESWELDALSPETLTELISEEIKSLIDQGPWDWQERREQIGRKKLDMAVQKWPTLDRWLDMKIAA